MTQVTFVAPSKNHEAPLLPEMLNRGFNQLIDCQYDPEGYRVTLELSYRPSMLARQGREYKQKRYLLGTFIKNALEVINYGERMAPYYQGFEEILDYMNDYELEHIFQMDETHSICYIDLSISFQKRFQPKGKGVNAIQKIDYFLSYDRQVRLGGKTSSVMNKHFMLYHVGCNYRDQYANASQDPDTYSTVDELLYFVEQQK